MKNTLDALKKKVIENLKILQNSRSECLDTGMEDISSKMYNEIYDLIEDTKASDNVEEIYSIIDQAIVIEKAIDVWLSSRGLNTSSLNWPSNLS